MFIDINMCNYQIINKTQYIIIMIIIDLYYYLSLSFIYTFTTSISSQTNNFIILHHTKLSVRYK